MSFSTVLLLLVFQPPTSYSIYCPYQHRHLGENILKLQGLGGEGSHHYHHDDIHHEDQEPVILPQPSFWTAENVSRNQTETRLICPSGCLCKASDDDVKVVCGGHYMDHFPLDGVPSNTSKLIISPSSSSLHNKLTLSPSLRMLRSLNQLYITHSNIPNIGKRTLYGLSKLESLNLSHNSISHLVDANFDGLNSLSSLSLSHNNIRSITSAAFHHLANLEHLSLDHNNIKELAPRIFYKLEKLKHLDLSHNKLLLVDEEVLKDIRNIQHLSCSSCGLSNFRVGFGLRFLRDLILSNNHIENIGDIEPHLVRALSTLDVSGNRITKVDKLDMIQIEVLNLSRNKIEKMEDCAFCSCTKLTHIDVSRNVLMKIGNSFGEEERRYEKLKYFDLSHNMIQVSEITETIKKFPQLESIHLANMNLISIPDNMFQENIFLTTVNLSSNYLVSLDSHIIATMTNLHKLDLSHNLFMGLDETFFKAVDQKSSIEMVYLQGNPWTCDKCNILHLRHWLQSSLMYWGACFSDSRHGDHDPSCLRCVSPAYLNYTPVQDLVIIPDCSHMNPDFSSMTATITTLSQYLAIGILLVVLTIVVVLFVSKYRHYGVYKTGEEDDKESRFLTDPIHNLCRDSESYVNLRYPTLTKE